MKLTSTMAVLGVLLASAVGVLAADKSNEKPKAAHQTKAAKAKEVHAKPAQKPELVALTGSYIKRNVRRNGVVTDGPNPVVVLDNDAIHNSGAADLREALLLRGLNR